jgi:GWxTD domain-containing protein
MRRLLELLLPGILILCLSMRDARAVTAVVNHAMFRDSLMRPYLKFYWEIDPASLHYKRGEGGILSAKVKTEIRVRNDTGIIYRDNYFLQTKPHQLGDVPPQVLEQVRLPLPATGMFKVELRLSEEGFSAGVLIYTDSGSCTPPAAPFYSSIQLLDTFLNAKNVPGLPTRLLQGGFANIPKPLAFYNEGQHQLTCYYELYHADSLPLSAYPLYQVTYISKRPLQRIAAEVFLRDTILTPAQLIGFHENLSLASLSSDNWYLNTSLQDAKGREYATGNTLIQLLNKNPVADTTRSGPVSLTIADTGTAKKDPERLLDLGTTFVAKFDMARLRAILKMILPRADPSDLVALQGFLEKPDEIYMRYFIYNYFRSINPEAPDKAWNKFVAEIREVNRRFNSGGRMGYETDRGIVWLRYGEPVELVRVQNESGSRPYEVWRYNQDEKIRNGGGVFLFYSATGLANDFQLLHSTVRGERFNPDWRSILYLNGSTSSTNSRAEQYLTK